MALIGISCFYHDSAAALVSEDGEILAAVQEERFTRLKNDSSFPYFSIDYCLKIARESNEEISAYIYYEKPIRVFMRLLETYFDNAPRGITSFLPAMDNWLTNKLFTKENLIKNISLIDNNFKSNKLFFSNHHLSHAASAFYPSTFEESAILCIDAVGEWSTTSAWIGNGNKITPLWEIEFPHSLGLLYSAFTYFCGFKVNSGEYKLMGLAPYGEPIYFELIKENLININKDGSFKLNMEYFKYQRGLKMISSKFYSLFKSKERFPNEEISKLHIDMAASIQKVLEECVIKITKNLNKITSKKNLCLSGGVALNCVANGKILDESGFENLWIQPASGDSGSALGGALAYLYQSKKNKRQISIDDSMKSGLLGPAYKFEKIKNYLDSLSLKYQIFDFDELYKTTASYLANGKIIGWFQGRLEYGPRALGNRSILGDPRIENIKDIINSKVKQRESFRPFAPVIMEEFKEEYFNLNKESKYMLLTRKLDIKFHKKVNSKDKNILGAKINNKVNSIFPGITHIDGSCRVQTITRKQNLTFYKLLESFYKETSCPMLINTSFNLRGEPIVCSPEDALKCFVNTNIDFLVLDSIIIDKKDIPKGLSEYLGELIQVND